MIKFSMLASCARQALQMAVLVILMLQLVVVQAVETQPLDQIIAVVNDDVITRLELENEIRNIKMQIRQQGMQQPSDSELVNQVMERMIVLTLQLQLAKRRSIRVDDDRVNSNIEDLAKKNKMDLIQFSQVLRSEGINFEDYRKRIRDELVIRELQRLAVRNRISVTNDEIDRFLANQDLRGNNNDEYHLGHILVAIPEAATSVQIQKSHTKASEVKKSIDAGADFSQIAITKSDGQQALNGGDIGWRKLEQLPTLFSDIVVSMNKGDVSSIIRSSSGYHIIKLLDKRRNEKQYIVQQTKARHILIKPNLFLSDKEAKIRAQQLKQRIEAGEKFEDLAMANSDDKSSAIQGGDLGWVNPGVMVKPFEDAMNKLSSQALSGPVRSPFGWHIIQVLDRRKQDNTKEFQRNQARATLKQRKWQPALVNWIRRIRDEAFVDIRL